MTTKTKALLALSFGGICVALGLLYGVSGHMHSSISRRGDNIARWEKELVKERQEAEAFLAEMDRLGKKTDATPDERRRFENGVARIERTTEHLRFSRERVEEERARRRQQIGITAGFCILGVLSMLGGLVLVRRARR